MHNIISSLIYKTIPISSILQLSVTRRNVAKMRAVTILSFLCVLALSAGQSHDLIMGQATYGDIVIYKVNEYKYGWPLIVRTSTIEFPEPGQQNFAYIKAIYVKDNFIDGNGGYPTILTGGVGQRFVTIKLKSQRHHGFNFTITIYGRF